MDWAWMVPSKVENTDTTLVISDSKRVDRGEPGGHSFTPYRTMQNLLSETNLGWSCVLGEVVGWGGFFPAPDIASA